MALKKTYDHYVNVLPSRLVEDDHYFVRVSATKALHYIGGRNNVAILVGGSSTGGGAEQVTGEIPTGLINGSNATFTSAFPFDPLSVEVFLNGLRQQVIADYNTVGNTQIIFLVSPESNTSSLLINYKKL